MIFNAHQFNRDTCEMTGQVEAYVADDIHKAVAAVIYTHSISGNEGKPMVGPTGRVVHGNRFGYSVVPAIKSMTA